MVRRAVDNRNRARNPPSPFPGPPFLYCLLPRKPILAPICVAPLFPGERRLNSASFAAASARSRSGSSAAALEGFHDGSVGVQHRVQEREDYLLARRGESQQLGATIGGRGAGVDILGVELGLGMEGGRSGGRTADGQICRRKDGSKERKKEGKKEGRTC